jgi:putative ABC transport system substrate-binding protein
MRRREFITLLGSTAAAWPMAARAQQMALPVVGWLGSGSAGAGASPLAAFRSGLKQTGFTEDGNVRIEYRWAENQYDRLPMLADDLVRRQVAVIVASGAVNSPLAAKAATTTIPIVFMTGSDPVEMGLVARLNRPDGNMTGVTLIAKELAPKRLEILHELIPHFRVIGLLANLSNPNAKSDVSEMQALAGAGGWRLQVAAAGTIAELDAAFASLAQQKADAFVTGTDAFLNNRGGQIAALAARYGMPGIFAVRDLVDAGGLISYGASVSDVFRQVGVYAGRILKGEKPADLPVQQPTKFELVINLNAAKAIALTIPESFLARADEVIE